jgi:hypothetical protein
MKKEKSKTNTILNIESYITKDNIEIRNTEGYFSERFWFTDYLDDKKLTKFIKKIEKAIRISDEYKEWVGDLHISGLNKCAVLGNIAIGEKVSIELHHYPFTLYDIVYLCIMRHIKLGDKFNSFTIIDEILDDHANKNICVVPLCKTIHQLVHAGEIFIPLTSVYGNIDNFIEKYYDTLQDNEFMLDNYNKLVELTEKGYIGNNEELLRQAKNAELLRMKKEEE